MARLSMETSTGRKHQVRVHCAEGLGSPILMDPVYADQKEDCGCIDAIRDLASSEQQRFFLHASSLSIPLYGIESEAPLPGWWHEAIAAFKESN